MTSAFQAKLLALALLDSVHQHQICSLLQVFIDCNFCIPFPYNEKDIFWGCQFQKVLQIFVEPFTFSLFSIIRQGMFLDSCGIEWFALEMNRDPSVVYEIAYKYCILYSFVYSDGYSISFKGFLPTILDKMVICVKFTHSSPFQFTDF